jgi:AAA domain
VAGELVVLTGAPGSGKTAVVPGLRAALPGVVVLDMDQFLDAGGRLAGLDLHEQAAADRWPAYNDLCLSFVAAVLAAGHDVLLLCPLTPDEVGRSAVALGTVRWLVLDCSDATRRHRLRTRPGAATDADGAVADAAELRALGLPVLRNDGIDLAAAADLIAAAWPGQPAG